MSPWPANSHSRCLKYYKRNKRQISSMLNHYSTHQHKGHNMVVAVTGDSYYRLSDGLATSVGKSEFCIHTWDTKRLLGVLFHSLSTHTNSEDKHTVPSHEEQRARGGGLRIWTAQETECVLEVGWIRLTWIICFCCWRFAGGMETRNHPYVMCAGRLVSLTVWFMKIGIGIVLILLLLVASRCTFMTR